MEVRGPNNEDIVCTVTRDGWSLDGETYAPGDVVLIPAAFAHDLITEGEVERLDL